MNEESDKCCPECDKPTKRGEICDSCREAEMIEIERAEERNWYN